ncbi:predicted protein [Lichtheimia corymbifera JMRC:FSU:9682]|uniref:Uncharacterized protein n=1 Tax=Lichtheimia corymbifera JMRC:FSU:9682 TaxID=1263082 RepID=A0A068SBI2_9FUNG|nr:predicted protein [Lichtheimia corymbifera JMRC:FSU:9682]
MTKRPYVPHEIPGIDEKEGLQTLYVSCAVRDSLPNRFAGVYRRQLFSEDDMVRFIMLHCDTLETIIIGSELPFSSPRRVKARSKQVIFRRLRTLSYGSDSDRYLKPFLLWLEQNAPNLQT